MMRLELATEAYIGARSQQQDAAAVEGIDGNRGAILILADGLGGHESGAEASWIVVDTCRKAAEQGAFTDPARRHRALRDAIEDANTRIAGGVNPAHGHRGMASTAVVAVVAEGELSWISVGDSHLYLWRRGRLKKLNEDHSQAGLMVRSGQYKESDPEVLAAKSVLVSALTGRKLEIVDHPSTAFALEAGDVLILASDGLNTISEEDIAAIVAGNAGGNAKALSTALIDAVKERRADRQDNTTVAVTRVLSVPKRQASEPLADPLARPRQEITTPTEISPANQRTQIQSPPQKPRQSASLETTQVPDQPTLRAATPANANPEPTPRPASETAATLRSPEANIRTAVPSAAEAPTAIPGAPARPAAPPRPVPELKAERPLAHNPKPAQPKARLPLLGLIMLALATILAGLLVGRMTGIWDPIGALFSPGAQEQAPPAATPKRATERPVEPPAPAPLPAAKPQAPSQAAPAPTPPPAQPQPQLRQPAAAPPRPDSSDDKTRVDRPPPTAEPAPRTESPATPEQQRSQPQPGAAPRAVPPPPTTSPDKSGALPVTPEADPRRQIEAERRRLEQQERARRAEEQRRLQEQEAELQRRAQAATCNPLSDGSRIQTFSLCIRWCDANTAPGTMDQQECRTWCRGNCPQ